MSKLLYILYCMTEIKSVCLEFQGLIKGSPPKDMPGGKDDRHKLYAIF